MKHSCLYKTTYPVGTSGSYPVGKEAGG